MQEGEQTRSSELVLQGDLNSRSRRSARDALVLHVPKRDRSRGSFGIWFTASLAPIQIAPPFTAQATLRHHLRQGTGCVISNARVYDGSDY
jgi:hypothetical protein